MLQRRPYRAPLLYLSRSVIFLLKRRPFSYGFRNFAQQNTYFMQQRRVNFHTLGCKLNFSESSTLAREFEEGGFVRVAPDAEADICVANSCSVTEHADKKCRNLIRSRQSKVWILSWVTTIRAIYINVCSNFRAKAVRRFTVAMPIRSHRSSRPFRAATARGPSSRCRTAARTGAPIALSP